MVLLLWWKRGSVRWRELLALVPFFLLGLSLGLLTAWLEQHHVGAQGLEWELTSVERILVAGRALWFYAGKLVWPAKLTFNYPRWQINAGVWWQYAYPFGVLLMVTLLWIFRSRVGRGPLVGMLFFCGTLFPALGFFDVYPFRYSYVADHFQYLASSGLIVVAVAGLTQVASRLSPWPKRAGMALGLAVLVLLAAQTLRQGYVYENLETLWMDTLEKNPASWLAHYNLGILLAEQGKTYEAIDHYNEALQVKTDYVNIYINLGVALAKQERLEEAIGHYHQALQIMPDHPNVHNNLGNALARQGKVEEAASHYLEALRIEPNHAEAHYNLGLVLAEQGKVEQAISHYSEVLRITPNHLDAHINLGVELAKQGRLQEAASHFSKALQIKPDDATARRNLELALQLMGKSPHTTNTERTP
jgi:tetratricopeptide (TPR) repeat protein